MEGWGLGAPIVRRHNTPRGTLTHGSPRLGPVPLDLEGYGLGQCAMAPVWIHKSRRVRALEFSVTCYIPWLPSAMVPLDGKTQ